MNVVTIIPLFDITVLLQLLIQSIVRIFAHLITFISIFRPIVDSSIQSFSVHIT